MNGLSDVNNENNDKSPDIKNSKETPVEENKKLDEQPINSIEAVTEKKSGNKKSSKCIFPFNSYIKTDV